MNVVFLLPGYSRKPIGGYRVVFEYANYLTHQGHNVLIGMGTSGLRSHRSPGLIRSHLAHIRNRLVRLMYSRSASAVPWFDLDPAILLTHRASTIRGWVKAGAMVVGTEVTTWAAMRNFSAKSGKPPVILLQHYEEWAARPSYIDQFLADAGVIKIAISGWLRREVERTGGSAILIPNAIDGSVFSPGAPISERPLEVAAMLSPVAEKRSDLLIDVFRELNRFGIGVRTFGIRPQAAESLPGNVTHVVKPDRSALAELLRSVRVFVCASDSEGFGLPPAEALLCETSVASTANEGVLDYADGVALFSPVGDAAALARNVLELLNDPILAQRLAKAGAERLRAHTPRRAAELFEEVLVGVAR